MKKLYCVIYGKYRKFKNPKIPYIFEKTFVLSIICISARMFKEEESIEILKILGLIENI